VDDTYLTGAGQTSLLLSYSKRKYARTFNILLSSLIIDVESRFNFLSNLEQRHSRFSDFGTKKVHFFGYIAHLVYVFLAVCWGFTLYLVNKIFNRCGIGSYGDESAISFYTA